MTRRVPIVEQDPRISELRAMLTLYRDAHERNKKDICAIYRASLMRMCREKMVNKLLKK